MADLITGNSGEPHNQLALLFQKTEHVALQRFLCRLAAHAQHQSGKSKEPSSRTKTKSKMSNFRVDVLLKALKELQNGTVLQ